MADFGRSDHPAVQQQLDRLAQLSLPQGRFGLETMHAMMARLDNPHQQLPPVFHVAGTNGKGSTCAFLRAMLEAGGKTVHVTSSPHLVRYNERIRIAGKLIEDDYLAELLAEVLDACEDLGPSFFEVTIAASFLAFSRNPADACVVEVGLGGRFDATNVIEKPAVCGIAALGIDHERFLLAPEEGTPTVPIARIAFEKAGIAKPGVPLVTMSDLYPPEAQREIRKAAQKSHARLHAMQADDYCELGAFPIALRGQHQLQNAALAAAMIRAQNNVFVSPAAITSGMAKAVWPARMQRLAQGPLTGSREVWLDGGHNRNAGEVIASEFEGVTRHLIIGMLDAKDPAALVEPLAGSIASITVVPVPDHPHHPREAFGAEARFAKDVPAALAALPDDGLPVLIAGSLYLAGEVLRLNHEAPD